MKRDDQILALRTQNDAARDKLVQTARDRDRALNQPGEVPTSGLDPQDEDAVLLTDGFDPSKIIVIHPGSQNLRIGLASDALPKTIPMCIATSSSHTESEVYEARPRRQFEAPKIEQQYGEEWARKYKKMCEDLKVERRQNKLRVLPNSKELVINYNRRSEPEQIAQHNDPSQVEWTEVAKLEDTRSAAIFGHHALRVADNSNPKFRLFWPMQYGYLHEDDYKLVEHLYGDFEDILTHAMEHELGLDHLHDFKDYSCVFVIPRPSRQAVCRDGPGQMHAMVRVQQDLLHSRELCRNFSGIYPGLRGRRGRSEDVDRLCRGRSGHRGFARQSQVRRLRCHRDVHEDVAVRPLPLPGDQPTPPLRLPAC